MGQINALLFLCVALVVYFARRGRPWFAGFFIALAALIKIYPAVLLLFFAAKRQFKPVLAAMVSAAVLAAASLTVCDAGLYRRYLLQVLPRQVEAGAFYRNQGLAGLFARLLTANAYVNALGNWPALARALGIIGSAFVVIAALWVAARRGGNRCTYDLEFGLCLVATLLALSKSYEHYAVMLLFAYFAILKFVAYARNVPRASLLLVFLSFCTWTFVLPQDIDYQKLPRSILMQPFFSAKCLATAMLFVACVWFLLKSDQGTLRDVQRSVQVEANEMA
jgi:hypothetical protein